MWQHGWSLLIGGQTVAMGTAFRLEGAIVVFPQVLLIYPSK